MHSMTVMLKVLAEECISLLRSQWLHIVPADITTEKWHVHPTQGWKGIGQSVHKVIDIYIHKFIYIFIQGIMITSLGTEMYQ